jgi:hypothetical protein
MFGISSNQILSPNSFVADLGSVYFDVKWFPLENIFREIIFPEIVLCRKQFTVFTMRTENHKIYIYIY